MEFFLEEGKQLHGQCSTLVLAGASEMIQLGSPNSSSEAYFPQLTETQPRFRRIPDCIVLSVQLQAPKTTPDEFPLKNSPALSIGNVGQLAVDLLVSSMKAARIGYLDDPYVLPCIGNNAYEPLPHGELALPLEVYESTSNALTLVQQRSPVIKGKMVDFGKNLADFIATCGMKHVVLLSSLDFGRWQQIDTSSGSQIHYLSSTNEDGTDENCEQLGWRRLPEYDPEQLRWKYLSTLAKAKATQEDDLPLDEELEEGDYLPSLPFASLFTFLKANGVKVTCLLCYCSEGDNIHDASNLAEATVKLLGPSPGGKDIEWAVPFSWKSVYGPPPDMSIF